MGDFLLLATIFLTAGVIAVPIASRLGLGSVLGYLLAGIAISPLLSWLHVNVIAIQHFAEFGVVMMLFLVGLELEPEKLWNMRTKLAGLGGLQVGGTALAVMAVAMLFGQPWTFALAIGLIFALSSTAIVLQTLNEKGLMKSDGGQSAFSVLLFQDIAVIPMLALMPLLAMPELADSAHHLSEVAHGAGDAGHGADGDGHGSLSIVDGLVGWQRTLVTLGAVAFVILAGNFLTRPLFRFIAAAKLRELFTAAALLFVVGIALLMTVVGLSPALGTFLAGVVLANSEYRHELESDIDPFKGLLLGLFFMTVGAGIDFGLLGNNLALIVGLTLGLMTLKAIILLIIARLFKIPGPDKWLFALGLAQAGEFGFVLLSFTVTENILPEALADQLLLVVAMSMLLTPALFILYDKVIAPRYSFEQEREADDIEEPASIIIAGHGRFGGIVNRILRYEGYHTTVLDYSSEQLEMLRRFDLEVYYGDATRPDLLHAAGIEDAKVLVIAIDEKEHITALTRYVTQNYPHVHIVARSYDRLHTYEVWYAGSRDIIRETYDSSLRAGRSAMEAMGLSREEAQAGVDRFEKMDRSTMVELASLFDPDIPLEENEAYVKRTREMMEEHGANLHKGANKNRS